jgi:hypothetical protein
MHNYTDRKMRRKVDLVLLSLPCLSQSPPPNPSRRPPHLASYHRRIPAGQRPWENDGSGRASLRCGSEAWLRRWILSGRLGTTCAWPWRRSCSDVASSTFARLHLRCKGIRPMVVLPRGGFPTVDRLTRGVRRSMLRRRWWSGC